MHLLVLGFLVICAIALVCWGLEKLTLPPTIKTAIYVLIGLAILVWLYNLASGSALLK